MSDKKNEVVATGEALRLAAEWLGTDEKEVIDQVDGVEEPAFGQFSGLGYRRHKVPKTKRKSVWKVDEHLTQKLSVSRRQQERRLGGTTKRHRSHQSQNPAGDEEEEEMGRSQIFSGPKERKLSKGDLLVASKTRRKKKKNS